MQTKAQITHVESMLFYCAISSFLVTRSQLLRAPFPVLTAFPRLGFPTYCYAYSALLSEVRDASYISLLECYVLLSPVVFPFPSLQFPVVFRCILEQLFCGRECFNCLHLLQEPLPNVAALICLRASG